MENLAISFFERIKEQVTLRTIKYCILMAGILCVCVPSLYGEENPCNEEDYNLAPSEEIQMGGM